MSHNHRVILHSSFISRQGEGILFTAPSGTGKSTQADLWKRHEEGVTIINGDRSILGFKRGKSLDLWPAFLRHIRDCREYGLSPEGGGGAPTGQGEPDPASGTAGSLLAASVGVYGEHWDTEGTENIMDLLIRIVRTVPVYYFACLPDFSAVEMLKAALADDYCKGSIYGEAKKKYTRRGKICREPRWGVISRSVHI